MVNGIRLSGGLGICGKFYSYETCATNILKLYICYMLHITTAQVLVFVESYRDLVNLWSSIPTVHPCILPTEVRVVSMLSSYRGRGHPSGGHLNIIKVHIKIKFLVISHNSPSYNPCCKPRMEQKWRG